MASRKEIRGIVQLLVRQVTGQVTIVFGKVISTSL